MAKLRKNLIFIVILALCVALSVTLVACNNDKPTETANYTITVKYGDTNQFAQGVSVSIKKGGAILGTAKQTDENGKVTFELAKGEYDVVVKNPEHYTAPANLKLTADSTELAVTLERNFAYVVKLVNPDGTAFYAEGVEVGVCTDSNCLEPVALGEGGVAYIEQPKANYHVKIDGLNGYAYNCDENNYYTGKEFSATVTEMTITLYPVQVLNKTTGKELKDEEKLEKYIPVTAAAYKFETELKAGEQVYYSFTSELSGEYTVYVTDYYTDDYSANKLAYGNMNNKFTADSYNVMQSQYTYDANKTYYYTAVNKTGDAESLIEALQTPETLTAEIIIVYPSATYIETDGKTMASKPVTVNNADVFATIKFTPNTAGIYTITANGETYIASITSTSADALANENWMDPTYVPPMKDLANKTYTANNTLSVKFTEDLLGGSAALYFGVAIKADTYPASVNVKIEFVKGITNTTTVAEVKEELEQQTAPAKKELEKVPMQEDALTLENGKYYYNDGNGNNLVYVVITKPIELLYDQTLAYFGLSGMISNPIDYTFDVTSAEDKANLNKGNTYADYNLFIRGFKDYEFTGDRRNPYAIPEKLDTENCYANYADATNGAYPLTEELETFLKTFYDSVNADGNAVDIIDAAEGYEWMFALYYYVDEKPVDAIVGEYQFVSYTNSGETINVDTVVELGYDFDNDVPITGPAGSDYYHLVMTKNGKYTIYDSYGAEFGSGTWSNVEGVYYAADDMLNYEVTFNPSTGSLELAYHADPEVEWDFDTIWQFTRATED